MADNLEIEVKYLATDPQGLRERILRSGWPSLGKHFETNICFEDAGNTLRPQRKLLRLRQDANVSLTFKSKAKQADPRYKTRREIEVRLDDFHSMKAILKGLGFHQDQVYEKYRETFQAGKALICLDQMPFGVFVEVEGSAGDIQRISRILGFSESQAITTNYLTLFNHIQEMESLPFKDVTFEHFKDYAKDYSHLIRSFEAGRKRHG